MRAKIKKMLALIDDISRDLYNLPLTDSVLVYFVLLNFILAVPTIIIGLLSHNIIFYFQIYTILLFVTCLLFIKRNGKNFFEAIYRLALQLRNTHKILVLSVISLWSFYIILIIFYTPILRNWDAIAVYLPMAKAIQTTGSLLYNPFFLSEQRMASPPLFPILYAFIMYMIGASYLKIVPAIYFLLLLMLIYKFGSEFFDINVAVLMVFSFLVMPTTQTYFGSASLYLDLGYTFYLLASVYFLLKCFRDGERRNLWCFLLGMSSGLLFMSKEYGAFLFFVVFSLFLFNLLGFVRNLYAKTFLAACMAFFPYIFLSIWNLIAFGATIGNAHPYYYFYFVFVLFFLFVYSCILTFINRRFSAASVNGTRSKLILFLLPAGLSMIHTLFNVAVREQVFNWQFGTMAELAKAGVAMPSFANLDNASWGFLNVYNFFIAFPMVLVLVPLLTGLLKVCNDLRKGRLTRETGILLLFSLYLLFICGTSGFSVGGGTFRYWIPLALVISTFTFFDYKRFPFRLEENSRLRYQFQFSLISLAFLYVWFVMDRSRPYWILDSNVVYSQPYATLLDLLVFIAIFTPYILERISSVGIINKRLVLILHVRERKLTLGNHRKSKLMKILFLSALVINLSIPSYLIYRASSIISMNTWDPAYYGQVRSIEAFYKEPLIEVADFYLNNINDSHVTVTLGMFRLAYILERPFIDLVWSDQVNIMSSILKSNNHTEIVGGLMERNIRYFLLPTPGNSLYETYSYYRDNFELFKIVEQQQFVAKNGELFSFTLLNDFRAAKVQLFELRPLNVTKLKYYFSLEETPILISDDDQANLYTSTTQEISLSDAFIENMKGLNTMKIEITPYSSPGEYIIYRLKPSLDISKKDFISFYWYGNNSGLPIALRFFTGDWRNQYEYVFNDRWNGYAKLIIPLNYFKVLIGSPRWDRIDAVSLVFYDKVEQKTTFYLDQLVADTGAHDLLVIPLHILSSPLERLQKLTYYFYFEENPLIISDDNQSRLYQSTIQNISTIDASDIKIKGENALKIEIFPFSTPQQHQYIRYAFKSPIDFSNKDFVSFYWYGNDSGIRITLRFESGSWKDQYEFSFIDSWNGEARLIIPLRLFKVHIGSPSWNSLTSINFVFYEEVKTQTTFYLDRVTADTGITDFYFLPIVKP